MASAIGNRFSLLRFSLSSLFLFVTALGLFLGYELEWARRRKEFIEKHGKLFKFPIELPDFEGQITVLFASGDNPNRLAPSGLWLFNERAVAVLCIFVKDGVTEESADDL